MLILLHETFFDHFLCCVISTRATIHLRAHFLDIPETHFLLLYVHFLGNAPGESRHIGIHQRDVFAIKAVALRTTFSSCK